MAGASAQDYHTDARLKNPVSLRLKAVPMSIFVKQFGQAAGVPMAVAPNIADRKITIIFKERPAVEAMQKVAETFFCSWTYDGSSYRLLMPRENALEESGLIDAENEALKKRFRAYVANLTAMAARPQDQVLADQKRIRDEMQTLRSRKDADAKKRLQQLRAEYEKVANAHQWDLGFALKGAPNAADALLSGTTLFASTKKGEALPLAATATPHFQTRVVIPGPDGKPTSELRTPGGAVMAIRLNQVTGELETMTMATGLGDSASGGMGAHQAMLDTGEVEAMLRDNPLKKRLREWARDENGSVTARKLAKPGEAKPAGYVQKAYTLAEHLEFLADAADISVVADAFRLPVGSEQFFSAPTVGEYVRSLRDMALPPTRSGYFRTEGGWLMARHPHFWRRLQDEIPESAFVPLESKAAAGEMPTLEDYAAFAMTLSPWQTQVFADLPPLTRFPRLPLVDALPALRLWGSLNASQREAASQDGLTLQAMTPQQQEMYRSAILSRLWMGPVKETFMPLLLRGRTGPDLKLFFRDGKSGFQGPTNLRSEAMDDNNQRRSYSVEDIQKVKDRSFGFLLGEAVESSESFNLILPIRE